MVTFPVKAYASYTVSLGRQKVSSVPGATADVSVAYKSYANNAMAQVTITLVSGGTKELYITATPYYTGYDSETVTKPVTIDMMNVGTTTTAELDAGTVIDISAVTDGTVEQKIQSGAFYVICITNTDGATTIRDAWLVSTTDGKTLTAAKL